MTHTFGKLVGAALVAAVLTLSAGPYFDPAQAQSGHAMIAMATSSTKAAGLRPGPNMLFQEHIYLAAAATGAAPRGPRAGFKAPAGPPQANPHRSPKAV